MYITVSSSTGSGLRFISENWIFREKKVLVVFSFFKQHFFNKKNMQTKKGKKLCELLMSSYFTFIYYFHTFVNRNLTYVIIHDKKTIYALYSQISLKCLTKNCDFSVTVFFFLYILTTSWILSYNNVRTVFCATERAHIGRPIQKALWKFTAAR